MKTVILAGGRGTRLSEETVVRPKPMVEIGGRPMLWHIMSIYAHYGYSEFCVALGYKGEQIKNYFLNYAMFANDFSVDLATGQTHVHTEKHPNWKVHLVDTGLNTQTGGRIKRLTSWLKDETFMMTYGDGVANVDLRDLVDFHRSHGKLATLTVVRPPARFGSLAFEGDRVTEFLEKPQAGEGWINGGFMVLEPGVLNYIDGDDTPLEYAPMMRLVEENQLMAYRHEGFWQPMDTVREKENLQTLWESEKPPWKIWK